MDTRSKILTAAAALQAAFPRPLVVVTGTFDVLRAAHARELQSARQRTAAAALLVVVLPGAGALLPQRARAELVAALRVVDYVVSAGDGEVNPLLDSLKAIEIVRLEAADAQRTRQLIEYVQSRQTR